MDMTNRDQILDEAICISHSTNTLNNMHSTILFPAINR